MARGAVRQPLVHQGRDLQPGQSQLLRARRAARRRQRAQSLRHRLRRRSERRRPKYAHRIHRRALHARRTVQSFAYPQSVLLVPALPCAWPWENLPSGSMDRKLADWKRALETLRAEQIAAGPKKIEPNRRDVATVGVGDEDEQALSEM